MPYGDGVNSPGTEPRPGRKRFLSRAAIVAAGLQVVEADGLEALTVRRVATALGAAPMALYRHVADKRELLAAMLEEMAGGIPAPPAEGEPAERLVGAMLGLHAYLAGHLWLVEVLRRGEPVSGGAVTWLDQVLGICAELGLPPHRGYDVCMTLWWYLLGHLGAIEASSLDRRATRLAETEPAAPPERFPHLAAAIGRMRTFDHQAAFEDGLRALVTGLLNGRTPSVRQ